MFSNSPNIEKKSGSRFVFRQNNGPIVIIHPFINKGGLQNPINYTPQQQYHFLKVPPKIIHPIKSMYPTFISHGGIHKKTQRKDNV